MNNELYIKKCLALARKSEVKNEIPVGASINAE